MRRLGLLACLWIAACGGNGPEVTQQSWAYRDLGDLADAIDAAADRTDSDGDSIPDTIEAELGTDPNLRDSDFDGLVDNYEFFEAGYRRSDSLPDRDRDGLLAAVDNDEDGDRINDGVLIDTDGDGVPNFLEYYGYSYDFLTGEFVLWNGDPEAEHYFTDPLQPSTDQDAYPDGMEVSGLFLDPTVRAPGNDPLVAAYPNLVVEMSSYSITLNESIQLTETESISEGRTWTRQTSKSHSHTNEFNWGIGAKVGYDASATGGWSGEISANFGGSYASTNSASVSVSQGESATSAEGWSVARTTNPSEAAFIKLFLRVHNRGTAPISNIVPTLTLKIGGLNVATFEPGNAQVNMLVPGSSYPSEPGVFWVVDSIDTGNSVVPIALTMTELRAIERGAPVSVTLTQTLGDSMRLTPESTWESVGAAAEYIARCDAVCANLRIDLGDGQLVHHLVYADDTPFARPMELGEALQKLGVSPDGILSYVTANGTPETRSLDGFKFAVDQETMRANGWTIEPDGSGTPPDGFTFEQMRLLPDTNLLIRAPRGPSTPLEPVVHFAYLDPYSGEVKVSAADYEGILSVTVRHADGSASMPLSEDMPGAGFYSGTANDSNGFGIGTLEAEVVNLAGLSTIVELGELFAEPDPQPPIIAKVEMDLDALRVYATVESGNPNNTNSQIQWVRVYHPDLDGQFIDMEQVPNYYEDPHGMEAQLPATFSSKEDVKVVAYVSQDVWTEQIIPQENITSVEVRRVGAANVRSRIYRNPYASETGRMTLDAAAGVSPFRQVFSSTGVPAVPGPPVDFIVRVNNDSVILGNLSADMVFNARAERVGSGRGLYRGLKKGEIELLDFNEAPTLAVGKAGGIQKGDVYAVLTTKGLYAKIFIDSIEQDDSYFWGWKEWTVRVSYAVFEN